MQLQKLLQHTLFYGAATILPRILTFLLTPFYIAYLPSEAEFGVISVLMVYLIFGNVLLSYGMETTFFRLTNKYTKGTSKLQQTLLTSIVVSTLFFFIISFCSKGIISQWIEYKEIYIIDIILILSFDALTVIPFAWIRNEEKSKLFCIIKILNVILNFSLNILFFTVLSEDTLKYLGLEDVIHRILISLLIPSILTFCAVFFVYVKIGLGWNIKIWKEAMRYGLPILVAGLTFAISEGLDKLLLRYLLDEEIAENQVGIYTASYKLGMFMTLYITAFRLGVEPFFFKQISDKDAKNTYAKIMYYFIIGAGLIMVGVVAVIDILKKIIISQDKQIYWEGLWIVPIILTANLCLGIYHNLSVWYKVSDKTSYGAYFSMIGAVLTILINLWLIPILGYKGAAIATLSAYLSMMILSFLVGRKKYYIPYPIKKIYVVLSLALIISYLSFYVFFGNLIVGIIGLFIYTLLIIYLEKKQIKSLIKLKF